MNIIFGDIPPALTQTHTVLELDTFKVMPSETIVRTWCVVDSVPLTEFSKLEHNKSIHHQLIENYRQRQWDYCRSAIFSLTGCWNGELDSFYEHLASRVEQFSQLPLDDSWDYRLVKHQSAD